MKDNNQWIVSLNLRTISFLIFVFNLHFYFL